jgi:hypothetical protein
MANTLAGFAALGLLGLGSYFVYYGIAAGILNREIAAPLNQGMVQGRAALVRGVWYLIIGLFLGGGGIVVAIDLWLRD